MRATIRALGALLVLFTAAPARAGDVMAAVRADRWDEAAALAAAEPDPVAGKLVTFYRLLTPGAASAAEIGRFMAESPDWPMAGTLARRRDEALVTEPDDTAAAAACAQGAARSAAGWERCAQADAAMGRADEATAAARRAWVLLPGDGTAPAFLARWGSVIGPAEQRARFDRLAWTDTAAAARQIPRLDPEDRPAAEARLALRRDDPQALAMVAALPAAARAAPAMVLEEARYLRRAERDEEAEKLWLDLGTAAERAAPAEHRAAFWAERNLLARHRLRDNDPEGAYALAAGHAQTAAEQVADAEFLAGFIALRRLNDRARAAPHFARLAAMSRAAITQGRAHFWAAQAAADPATARREYQAAAAWPETFYGQLAILALGEGPAGLARRITERRDPAWDSGQALAFAARELARASAYLIAWGEQDRAEAFLLRLVNIVPDPVDRSLAARLAAGFGMPQTAVAIARRAGVEGVVLIDAGWPDPVRLPPGGGVEPALVLGVIRQESSFDTTTVSPAGAEGLMQLMPGTASLVARQIGLGTRRANLIGDPEQNVKLGTAYLRAMLDQFDGCTPLAVAAYNAGPSRVQEWLATYGDPRQNGVAMIDWIELIPYGETRNYVQRVIENEVIYRARSGEVKPHPLAQWLR
ncbi:MAG: lytic transglycosylase domain-containing protein [Alphaproteobacteria bacterium]|nr:lytic transglycosylase domain-containing protein [Alphaproteobacteria bacterium]